MSDSSIAQFVDVSIFQGERKVVEGVSFDISEGQLIYVLGKTGSGKSSVLKSMYGELDIDSGDAKVCGYDLNTIPEKEIPFLRRKLGVIFQDFQLLPELTVKKNLEFALKATGNFNKNTNARKIEQVLEKVELSDLQDVKPFELSGGEQQRVVIARALLNNPELIIADEPTGNLDPETSQEIMNIFKQIVSQGTSIIMATHDSLLIQNNPSKSFRVINHKWEEA